MSVRPAWKVLRPGRGGDVVLACDFSTAGRRTASFSDLVSRSRGDLAVWETVPAPVTSASALDGRAQVERWSGELEASGTTVAAVLGFCSGCVYAAALAERHRVPLVLFDPEHADAEMMLGHVRDVMTRFAPSSSGRLDAVLATAADATSEPDLMALAGTLGTLCREVVTPACDAMAIAPERSAEYVELSVSYLYWLAATRSLDPGEQWARATAVNGSTPGSGLRRFSPVERDGLVGDARYLDVPHDELLRSPEAVRLTDALLSPEDRT